VVDMVEEDPIGQEVVLGRLLPVTAVMVRDTSSPNARLQQIEQIDNQRIIKNLLLLLLILMFL
jgi:hypothetical protein